MTSDYNKLAKVLWDVANLINKTLKDCETQGAKEKTVNLVKQKVIAS